MARPQRQISQPYTVRVEPEHSRGRIDLHGVVTVDLILEAKMQLMALDGYQPAFSQLWVYLEVTSLGVTPEEMNQLVATTAALVNQGRITKERVAIVVRRDRLVGVAHLYKHAMARGAGQTVEVFATIAAAEAWLNRPLRA